MWDIRKGQFQSLVTFLAVFFLVCKLYNSGLYVIKYFGQRKCFIWRNLVFSFLLFSVYKSRKSNHQLLFLAIFLWSGNELQYTRPVNYTFNLKMSEILYNIYIWVLLVNIERILLLAFVKYTLHSYCTQNYVFCSFWRLKILVLWRKNFKNILIFVYLFCLKISTTDCRKTIITQE